MMVHWELLWGINVMNMINFLEETIRARDRRWMKISHNKMPSVASKKGTILHLLKIGGKCLETLCGVENVNYFENVPWASRCSHRCILNAITETPLYLNCLLCV